MGVLPNPSLVCSTHDRLIIGRQDVETRNSKFIQKAKHPRRWWASILEYHLIKVWMPFSFIEQRGRGGEE